MNKIEQFLGLSEGVPLKGHPYHAKTDAELHFIVKDAGEAAQAMKGHNSQAELKYIDQVNDASTVLHHRKNGGKAVKTESVVSEATEFHTMSAMPHHKVRITGEHGKIAKNLADGKSHTATAHHLITTYKHEGDTGTSHWADTHRDGDVVHLRDHYTKKHITTIKHSDLDKV